MAKKKPTKMLAVMGRSRRGGRWSVAGRSSVLACLGTCNLDMRRSSVDGDTFKMKVTVFLGSATFVLPPGATVKPSGMTLLAGSRVDVPETDEVCELPTLEIEWSTILGRIRVVTRSLDDDDEDDRHQSVEVIEAGLGDEVPGTATDSRSEPAVGAPVEAGIGIATIAPSIEVQQHTEALADQTAVGRRSDDLEADSPAPSGDDDDREPDAEIDDAQYHEPAATANGRGEPETESSDTESTSDTEPDAASDSDSDTESDAASDSDSVIEPDAASDSDSVIETESETDAREESSIG